jgi:hypothetical protein
MTKCSFHTSKQHDPKKTTRQIKAKKADQEERRERERKKTTQLPKTQNNVQRTCSDLM